MDDFLKKNEPVAQQGPLVEVKQIEFKYLKEKRCMRTYVFNLEQYVQDDAARNDLITKLKKTLGTACVYKEIEGFGFGYGVSGDFQAKIKSYLIDNKIVTREAFK